MLRQWCMTRAPVMEGNRGLDMCRNLGASESEIELRLKNLGAIRRILIRDTDEEGEAEGDFAASRRGAKRWDKTRHIFPSSLPQ